MTIDPKQLANAIEYVNDFAIDVDEEGLDRDGNARHFFAVVKAAKAILAALRLINKQAKDDGLWFDARYVSDAYLQQELRKLHAVIEDTNTNPLV